jgi:hypothetical protein
MLCTVIDESHVKIENSNRFWINRCDFNLLTKIFETEFDENGCLFLERENDQMVFTCTLSTAENYRVQYDGIEAIRTTPHIRIVTRYELKDADYAKVKTAKEVAQMFVAYVKDFIDG